MHVTPVPPQLPDPRCRHRRRRWAARLIGALLLVVLEVALTYAANHFLPW